MGDPKSSVLALNDGLVFIGALILTDKLIEVKVLMGEPVDLVLRERMPTSFFLTEPDDKPSRHFCFTIAESVKEMLFSIDMLRLDWITIAPQIFSVDNQDFILL